MSKKTKNASTTPDVVGGSTETDTLIVLLKTLADTTWRMFLPPALGAFIGWQVEQNGTPHAAVIGATAGLVLSGLLVWQQYRSVNRSDKK